jgi:hypothetical protein
MSVQPERTLIYSKDYGNSKVTRFSPPAVMELRLKDASPVIFHLGVLLVKAFHSSGEFPEFFIVILSLRMVGFPLSIVK